MNDGWLLARLVISDPGWPGFDLLTVGRGDALEHADVDGRRVGDHQTSVAVDNVPL